MFSKRCSILICLFYAQAVYSNSLSDWWHYQIQKLTAALTAASHHSQDFAYFENRFLDLVNSSNKFEQTLRFGFPTKDNRIKNIARNDHQKKKTIVIQAQNTVPIMHNKVWRQLIPAFIDCKRQYGSQIEKAFYANMTPAQFIDRLLTQRPLVFMTKADAYILRTGQTGVRGFESIGKDYEKSPLILADYLSYDEMQIAALLGVAVPTFFINDGQRNNLGVAAKPKSYQEQGVYVGLVGARFERPGLMESQQMIVLREPYHQGFKSEPGLERFLPSEMEPNLKKVWLDFYQLDAYPTYAQAQADQNRFIKINSDSYLDALIYKERMRLVIEPFLWHANALARQAKKQAYCHVVGLGTGVWAISTKQEQLILDVFYEIISKQDFAFIADLNFSWFSQYHACGTAKNGDNIKNIKIHFSKRNPADLLTGSDANKLLVAMYAWDGNAYPGNEYWQGALNASGDPAAACSSTIAELQNPLINQYLSASKLSLYGQ